MRGALIAGGVVVAAALGGGLLGRATAPSPSAAGIPMATPSVASAAAASPLATMAALAAPTPATIDDVQLESAVQRAVRAELRKAEAERDAQREHASAPSAEQLVAASNGQRLVQTATTSGRWTAKDAGDLRLALAAMHPAQARALMGTLIVAINHDQLRLEVEGAPF